MTDWSPEDLAAIAAAEEVAIAPEGVAAPVTIWIVRVDDELVVRAYTGPRSRWWRVALASGRGRLSATGREVGVVLEPADPAIEELVDEAYREKYAGSPSVAPMLADAVRETTLTVRPAP